MAIIFRNPNSGIGNQARNGVVQLNLLTAGISTGLIQKGAQSINIMNDADVDTGTDAFIGPNNGTPMLNIPPGTAVNYPICRPGSEYEEFQFDRGGDNAVRIIVVY